MMRSVRESSWLAAISLLACGPQLGVARPCAQDSDCDDTEMCVRESEGDGVCEPAPGSETGIADEQNGFVLPVYRGADILVVIDNSASMGEEQARLARGLAEAFAALPDTRIAFTTTDNGNPWCNGTSPEAGNLVLSSCRGRAGEFALGELADVTQESCYDLCPAPWSDIPITPTTTQVDPEPRARPWLELDGPSNVPPELPPEIAFGCLAPQGIAGCGFEQPLESMLKALRRSSTEGEASYGFLRPEAMLAVVFVTDEADCSHHPDHETIFLPEGDQVFWSDPDAASPTSAVCWNAGVACSGGPGVYDECHAVNLDMAGDEIQIPSRVDDASMMQPVSRYVRELNDIAAGKQVLVTLIAGASADGSVTYADAITDSMYQYEFGIGPGCEGDAGPAVPPVRLAELAQAFTVDGAQNIFSVCNENYAPALQSIADAIWDTVLPACMPVCVADSDPTTEAIEPACTMWEQVPTPDGFLSDVDIPPCTGAGELPSDDVNACFTMLTDGYAGRFFTDDAGDDVSAACQEEGWNLEFRLVRREGFPPPSGAHLLANCELSQDESVDCPAVP